MLGRLLLRLRVLLLLLLLLQLVLPRPPPGQMAPFQKLIVVHCPVGAKVVLEPNEALVEAQIRSDRVLDQGEMVLFAVLKRRKGQFVPSKWLRCA